MPWYLSHFKSMLVAGLKSMRVLHLRVSSVASPLRAQIARQKEGEIDIGKEEEGGSTLLATDLCNYPVLLPESKCDPIEIIAYWKHQ